ncbi:hypothetical protein NA57DRAFT_43067 [Rhizodiscina lignyota]|uniref:Vacuolar protein sorting-associated protein 8 central domain-containing protein n=1 Tax=Rhizodiscina lignyota TaxID=1504668 RepID=A0A9P4I7F8_9PEZI|nr:hypothetical protein NA57DRAFT_43067 [Rhizodiscina lignyota]
MESAEAEDAQAQASIALEDRPGTPSTPDDTPSRRGSLLSSPGSVSQLSVARTRRPGSLQPFDRRFSAQFGSSTPHSRSSSPAFLGSHSRQSSLATLVSVRIPDQTSSEEVQAPWEVVRWIKLKKLTGTAFSEIGRRNYGRPSCLAVANSIVIGTSKGLILVFDYHQTLVATIGLGTKAVESGAVTSLAISADHSTVAGGHSSGHIFTWEVARPAKPFLHIPPLPASQLENRRSDGHVFDKAILHVGFLGTRHTALVSADEGGMAFSHLATRGLGSVGRIVKTTRILGRYPPIAGSNERPRKPSSVLAFGPLPLGNVEQPTDNLGLTALLTPYLLVIVSTTPIAQTQHKAPRPKEVAPHSTLSGCLAWFPAVKLKNAASGQQKGVSKSKLAYCWSNVLTILEVDVSLAPEEDRPPELDFRPRSRWKNDEAIVAVQWLSRSVLGVLTISQRLVILEDNGLRVTDSYDLIQKHIFHRDVFSKQLHPVVEQLDEEDSSMHGVVADAFHMSFKAYKGRLFLLGFEDVAMGTLSNWADRLVALMEEGNFIAAIQLASAYYTGEADKLTVGLPDDATARHDLVRERLLEMIIASLKYTFPDQDERRNGELTKVHVDELASACFSACTSMDEVDFLFEEVYEKFSEASHEDVFFETLEPYILEESITSMPPDVMQALITHYASLDRASRLEDMLCRLDTSTLDIDHTLTLCKQYQLFDALVYIYNRALSDYISPLTEVLELLDVFGDGDIPTQYERSITKVFPYLAFCFTGRRYPRGDIMPDEEADKAKADLYRFIFSGREREWPPGSGNIFSTKATSESTYPYLRALLDYDSSSFMSMLNEAFEDSFLNAPNNSMQNGEAINGIETNKRTSMSMLPTRQTIISILIDVMASEDFGPEDSIYLDMFIARNLPKFPQFIILPGSALHRTLEGLCHYPSDELAADCELSVEYLLSQYHPSDIASLIPLFTHARFYRVLKSVYRGAKEYAKLLETCFADTQNPDSVFDNVTNVLRPGSGLTNKQLRDVHNVLLSHAKDLASIDAVRSAQILATYAPSLFEKVAGALDDDERAQFTMLQTVLEPEPAGHVSHVDTQVLEKQFEERYVQLMCKFNPSHVADYVTLLKSGDLRLDRVLPAMEKSEAIDAAVVLMARDGLVEDAMARLVKYMGTLQAALISLIEGANESPDMANTEEATSDLLDKVDKYCKVGIWLCQGQTRMSARDRPPNSSRRNAAATQRSAAVSEDDLEKDERLWLELVDAIVAVTKDVTAAATDVEASSADGEPSALNTAQITSAMRSAVQQTFSALLASTTSFAKPEHSHRVGRAKATTPKHVQQQHQQAQSNPSFLLILRCFLTRASARLPTLSDLRAVLADIFAAYTFESTILELSNAFLDKDVFGNVREGYERRVMGWRPKSAVCEVCGRRVWGPGAGGGIWEEWEQKREEEGERRRRRVEAAVGAGNGETASRGKGKESEGAKAVQEGEGKDRDAQPGSGPLVVFACGHIAHRSCLMASRGKIEGEHEGEGEGERFECPECE